MDGYVAKPIDPKYLFAAIASVLPANSAASGPEDHAAAAQEDSLALDL